MKDLYIGDCNTIGFENYRPIGDLVVDYSLDDLDIKNYYIREYYLDIESNCVRYNDYKVDKDSLIDISNYNNPVKFLGVDLSNCSDITYYMGEYIINE